METMEKPKRGAPPDPAVVARDAAVLAELRRSGPKTRNELAELMDLDKRITWLALDRLKRRGLVRKCAGEGPEFTWSADVQGGCP